MENVTKKLQQIFKYTGYFIFKLFYGKISESIKCNNNDKITVNEVVFDKNIKYKIYKVRSSRLYTDTIHDTAIILDNKIVEGPSFQIRNNNYVAINNNIVFDKGTPYLKKNLSGNVLSLLSGGGANINYWHWLFDVLPRIKLFLDKNKIDSINYFLVPNTEEKFQLETLSALKIEKNKIISSQLFRHITADSITSTDHPYVIDGDSTIGIQNIPSWIFRWLNFSFTKNISLEQSNLPKKFYIDRSDSKQNTKELRKIINEDEVKEVFLKNNYKILRLSDFSFIDQVKLFYNAIAVAGLHGGGFANLVFSKQNTKILELRSSSAGAMILDVAKKRELNYESISVNPTKYDFNNQNGHILIPIDELKKKLL